MLEQGLKPQYWTVACLGTVSSERYCSVFWETPRILVFNLKMNEASTRRNYGKRQSGPWLFSSFFSASTLRYVLVSLVVWTLWVWSWASAVSRFYMLLRILEIFWGHTGLHSTSIRQTHLCQTPGSLRKHLLHSFSLWGSVLVSHIIDCVAKSLSHSLSHTQAILSCCNTVFADFLSFGSDWVGGSETSTYAFWEIIAMFPAIWSCTWCRGLRFRKVPHRH